MFYIGSDGRRHTPFMVHRALFGSLERFTALLIEHYKGDFPFWFAPVQFGIVPIKEAHNAYAEKMEKGLKNQGFRVSLNKDNDNMRNKIKQFQHEKIPYILIAGDKEAADNTVSVRSRRDGDLGAMDISALCEYLKPQIEQGKPRCM